jgi:hypothetical protein
LNILENDLKIPKYYGYNYGYGYGYTGRERNKLWMNSNLLIGEKENWRRI